MQVPTFLPWGSEGGKASAVLDLELAGFSDSKRVSYGSCVLFWSFGGGEVGCWVSFRGSCHRK